jgi:small-conductance mechanosensitive channel
MDMAEPMLSLIHYGLVALRILIVVLLGALVNVLLQHSLRLLFQQGSLSEPVYVPLRGAVRGGIVLLVLLLSLQQAGVEVTGIWAAASALAAMLAGGFVALGTVLSNLLCTVLLLVFAPFRVGDDIEIIEATGGRGLRGRVVDLKALYTSLRISDEAGGGAVQVPNTLFFQKSIRRWSSANNRRTASKRPDRRDV